MKFLSLLWATILIVLIDVRASMSEPPLGRIEWRGFQESITGGVSGGGTSHAESRVDFTYIEEYDERGNQRWISRNLDWSTKGEGSAGDLIFVDISPGAMSRRWHGPYSISCSGGGKVNYGATYDEYHQGLRALETQRPVCIENPADKEAFGEPYPAIWTGPPNVGPVPWEMLREGCVYSKETYTSSDGIWSINRESITATTQGGGVLEVDDSSYGSFVPELGNTIAVTATSPTPALFRFTLDKSETSSFNGIATNKVISEGLFTHILNFPHLKNIYVDDSPDLFFDPYNYRDRELWADASFSQVETKKESTSVTALVSAMDYGAIGRLRGWVKGKCGVWQPLTVKVGSFTGDSLVLPRDDDKNFIADSIEMYRGLDPGVDKETEPNGDGTSGDGLTAFEEYRGFLVKNDEYCGSPIYKHVRTKPSAKDLFVYADGQRLEKATLLFAWASDLTLHLVCEDQYLRNIQINSDYPMKHRALNFTLQEGEQRSWQGKTISQAEPQHVITVGHRTSLNTAGFAGRAIPNSNNPNTLYFGPPKLTAHVWIDWNLDNQELYHTTMHELGHAVGIPHHSDHLIDRQVEGGKRNIEAQFSMFQRPAQPAPMPDDGTPPETEPTSLLIDPGPDCASDSWRARYRAGEFAGCIIDILARQGGQNSGNADCPMRYTEADFHEIPDSAVFYKWAGLVSLFASGEDNPTQLVHAWGGPVRRYLQELEGLGMQKFCSSVEGTKLNALTGDKNHAGNLGREKTCSEHIVINDLAIRGIP